MEGEGADFIQETKEFKPALLTPLDWVECPLKV